MPQPSSASAPSDLAEDLRAYFEVASGANDPGAQRLAALAAGELEPAEAAAARAAMAADERAAWEADIAAIDEVWRAPLADVLAARRARRRRAAAALGGFVLAAAAAVLLLARPGAEPTSAVRFKGAATAEAPPTWSLEVGVKRGAKRFRLGPGGTLETDDRIGFFYNAAAAGYLAIAYIDADGEIVRLYPRDGSSAAPAAAGRDRRLDVGATLTGAEGCEWVVGAFGTEPFDLDAFAGALATARAGQGPCTLSLRDTPELAHHAILIRR